MSTSGGTAGGGVKIATVHVDSAAIATLFSTPPILVAAPGTGQAVSVLEITYDVVAGNALYDSTGAGVYYDGNLISGQEINADLANIDIFGQVAYTSQFLPGAQPVGTIYTTTDVVNTAVVVGCLTGDPTSFGPVATTTLASGGAGYVIGDTGTIDTQAPDGGAAYVIDTVAAITGAVLTYHLTDPGTGYTTTQNPVTTTSGGSQPGVGTGFTVNVVTLAPLVADLYVTVYYTLVATH